MKSTDKIIETAIDYSTTVVKYAHNLNDAEKQKLLKLLHDAFVAGYTDAIRDIRKDTFCM